MARRWGESGNVFFALFGAVALVGVVGAATSTLMRGPVGTVVTLNQRAKADAQMTIAAKLAMLEAAKTTEDCDADGFIEPLPPDSGAGCAISLTGGGCIPAAVGSSKQDPWNTPYGYCSWDQGMTEGSGCSGGALLEGSAPSTVPDELVVAIISAGADRVFQTSCADDPAYVTKPAGSDDIILDYTYSEANEATAGLWQLKSGASDKITTAKDIDIQSDMSFASGTTTSFDNSAAVFGGGATLDLGLGAGNAGLFMLPTETELVNCSGANQGALRRDTVAGTQEVLQICHSSAWVNVGGSGGAVTAAGNPTEIQYNAAGALGASASLTYDGTTMNVEGALDANSGQFDGALDVDGAATLDTTLHVLGNTDFDGTLGVDGATTLNSTLRVMNNTDLDGTLAVDGATTIDDTFGVLNNNATSLSGTLNVGGAATMDGALTVTNDPTALGGTLDVDGTSNFDSAATFRSTATFDDDIRADSGSAADPGITFTSAQDTGFYVTGGNLGLTVGGAVRMTLEDTSGNVGIGTGDPDAMLDVAGEIKVGTSMAACAVALHGAIRYVSGDILQVCSETDSWVTIGTDGGGGEGVGSKWKDGVDSGDIYRPGGDVGIGVSDPDYNIDVAGTSRITGEALFGANVGIGAAPLYTLDVYGTGNQSIRVRTPNDNDAIIRFENQTRAWRMGVITGGSLQIYDSLAGAERMRINSSGYVGIGATIPADMLHVVGRIRIDDNVSAVQKGCIQFSDGANKLQFSHDCITFADLGSVAAGAIAINDLSDAYTDYATDHNLFMGSGAGAGIQSGGQHNILIGEDAGKVTTTGTGNTGLGFTALGSNTTGNENTAVGRSVMWANTTGADNTAMGYSALSSNTTGNENTAVGGRALGGNQTGGQNTAFGLDALRLNTDASRNVAIGYSAMQGNTTGIDNTAVGMNALMSNDTGGGNVAVGFHALLFSGAGANTALGYKAGNDITTGAKNILIGYDVDTPTATTNEYLNIGGILLGDIGLTSANRRIGAYKYCDENLANCFTAVTAGSPNAAGSDRQIQFNSAGAFGADANLVFTSAGNLGIGSAAPADALHVTGRIRVDDNTDAAKKGCVRFDDTANKLQFSHDCTTFADLGSVTAGAIAINDLSDAYTDYATDHNLFMGSGAGADIMGDGRHNVFIGENSGSSVGDTSGNTAVGFSALQFNNNGNNNTAMGYNAGLNVRGSANTSLGSLALGGANGATTGLGNTAVGSAALYGATTGDQNTAVGMSALTANTTGGGNTAVGYEVLEVNTTGGGNVAIGNNALGANTTGGGNNAIGRDALRANTSGQANTAVGANALDSNTTGTSNVALGVNAGGDITTGSRNIVIGVNIDAPTATTNEYLNIGGILLGDIGTTSGNKRVGAYKYCDENLANCFTAAGVAGGGGTPAGADRQIQFNNAGAFGADANFVFTATGRLGIGTAGPSDILAVQKDQNSSTAITVTNATSGTGATASVRAVNNGGAKFETGMISSGFTAIGALVPSSGYVYTDGAGGLELMANNAGGTIKLATGGTAEKVRIDSSGNVGIGTASPRGLLEVAGGGNTAIVGATGSYGVGTVISGSGGTAMLTNGAYLNSGVTGFNAVDSSKTSAGIEIANQDIYFRRWTAAVNPGVTDEMFIQGSTGNVGIGTTTPFRTLDVQGSGLSIFGTGSNTELMLRSRSGAAPTNLGAWHLSIRGDIGGANDDLKLVRFVGGAYQDIPLQIQNSTGNVGVGTASPGAKLQVDHPGNATYGTALVLNQYQIGNSDGPKMQFHKTMASSKDWSVGILDGVNVAIFGVSENGGTGGFGTPRLAIAAGGDVGIGTVSPGAKLEVAGQVKITGGTPGAGRVLTSDAAGLASWAAAAAETDPQVGSLTASTFCYSDGTAVQCNNDALTADNITTRVPSGFWQTSTATTGEGWPATSNNWYHLMSTTHSNTGNYYAMQFAGDFFNSNEIFYRATMGAGGTAWNRLWHSGNDGAGSGLDADTLDGLSSASFVQTETDPQVGTLTASNFCRANAGGTAVDCTTATVGDNLGGGGSTTGQITINNGSPTFYLQDTDNYSGMIHMNSNLLYLLSGCGVNSGSWCLNGSYWPLTVNMIDDTSTFGGTVIVGEGNMGVGTTNPINKFVVSNAGAQGLEVTPGAFGGNNEMIQAFNRSAGVYDNLYFDVATFRIRPAGTEKLTLNGTGNLGIGNTNPTTAKVFIQKGDNLPGIHLQNAAGQAFNHLQWADSAGSIQGYINNVGTIFGPAFFYTSDIRLKEDVKTIEDPLGKILGLRGVNFTWKADKRKDIGFIAQEVEEVLPEVVNTSRDPSSGEETKSVEYGNIVALAVESIKALVEKITGLEAQNAEMREALCEMKPEAKFCGER